MASSFGKSTSNVEPAATTAAGFDVPACGLDHVLDYREAETRSARRPGAVGAEETLEQTGHILVRGAAPVVGDVEHDLAVGPREADDAGGSFACVPERVLEQVLDDEAQHPPANRHLDRLILDLQPESEPGELGALGQLRDDVAQDRGRLGLPQGDDLAPLLE